MSALSIPLTDPFAAARGASARRGATLPLRAQARHTVTAVMRLVALAIDAGATPGVARDEKYAILGGLVGEVVAGSSAAPAPVAAALRSLDLEAGLTLTAERVVDLLRPDLSEDDVSAVLRDLVATRWPDGQRWQCDPGVALAYGARVLDPSLSARDLARLRRRRLVHRALSRRPASPERHLRVVPTPTPETTSREVGDPVLEGVLYQSLAAQAAVQRATAQRPVTYLPKQDGCSAAS